MNVIRCCEVTASLSYLRMRLKMAELSAVSMQKDRAVCRERRSMQLVAFAKDYGAKGLAYIAIQEDGTVKSSFAKFMTDEQMKALIDAMDGETRRSAALCGR